MGRIFGIENLPVAKPFPSLSFGEEYALPKIYPQVEQKVEQKAGDVFVKTLKNKKTFSLKNIFHRLCHK